jgi:hypothetical protein
MMNKANNNAAAVEGTDSELCEASQGSAQSAIAQAKKQTLKQPKEQAIKQPARELARWCHNTAQGQHSKASGSCSVFATRSLFRCNSP